MANLTKSVTKRVYCLYRVSTLGQVEKDDIPMQKQFCHDFIAMQAGNGWVLEREFSEKGISGFKVSAKDRDVIQEIQRDALSGKFDVLLVFMFDRLGRREDETPFVVEWFVRNGIEVWSATEGQQRFDSHVDKLLNYIRYWQASGESIKTSIRSKTRLEQLTVEGCYTGGGVPFGYKTVLSGRTNKRCKEVYDLAVDEDEAEIVKLIFRLYVHEGYGAQRICRYLAEQKIKRKDGGGFPNTSINRIIKNIMYTGVLHNGESRSEPIPALQIIDNETFERAQEIMTARTKKHSSVPLNTKGQSLLVGNIFCGHCGNRLTLTTSGRCRVRKDGTTYSDVRARYQCHFKVRHPDECDGQSGYGVKNIDCVVNAIIAMQFEKIKSAYAEDLIAEQHKQEIELAKARYKLAAVHAQECRKEQDELRAETIKVIRGTSKLNAELLNSLVEEAEVKVREAEEALSVAQENMNHAIEGAEAIRQEYARLVSWGEMFENCTFEAKKMIVGQFIKAIRLYRGGKLEIDFNVSFADFSRLSNRDEGDGCEVDNAQVPA